LALNRCPWGESDPLMAAYHDREWGVPLHDERGLFEFIVLEGAQAGLSWSTILRKRDAYREAFAGFDPEKIARFNARKIESLLKNEGIVRNRLKVEGTVKNARAYLALRESGQTLESFTWGFVKGKPLVNRWRTRDQIPATTAISDALSKALKVAGFTFVGSTIVYAHMQATGMVNDHLVSCFRHKEVQRPRASDSRA
jgi:DNA-3-methyladenine glycosylase I